jgi:hypothetical protein
MSKKAFLAPFKMFDAVSLGASQTSTATVVNGLDNIGMTVAWAGTSPVGTLEIQCATADLGQDETITWTALDFGSAISIGGASGTHTISINQLPYNLIRAVYTRASGTGSMTVVITGKRLGG